MGAAAPRGPGQNRVQLQKGQTLLSYSTQPCLQSRLHHHRRTRKDVFSSREKTKMAKAGAEQTRFEENEQSDHKEKSRTCSAAPQHAANCSGGRQANGSCNNSRLSCC